MAQLVCHFIDIGQGDSTLIELPNGEKMLVDVCIDNNTTLEYILSKLNKNETTGKKELDYLIITHPHDDHIKGIKDLYDNVKIKEIWETDHRLYVTKEERDKGKYKNYDDMLYVINQVKKTGTVKIMTTAKPKPFSIGDVNIYIFSPTKSYVEAEHPSENDIHKQCMVLKVEYKSNSIMFAGDSDFESWKERIVPYYSDEKEGHENWLESTILHVSHHGSHTFFTEKGDDKKSDYYLKALEKISPTISIISVGLNNKHGHPHPTALEYYKDYTFKDNDYSNAQVFLTQNNGTLIASLKGNGDFEVWPKNMLDIINKPSEYCGPFGQFDITVNPSPDLSTGEYRKNNNLKFGMKWNRKLPPNVPLKSIRWTVQNNGIRENKKVHNWYIGDDSIKDTYENRTAYHGRHILLCEVLGRGGIILSRSVKLVKVAESEK